MNIDIITSRVDKLRELMSVQKLDAFVLTVNERANSVYMCKC